MSYEMLIRFLAATALVVLIPGPNIMLVINNTIQSGLKVGVMTIAGINAGMVLLFFLSLAGISTVLFSHQMAFQLLKLFGVIYLCYLGITQITNPFTPVPTSKPSKTTSHSPKKPFIKGFFISFSNPKGIFFAGAFFPQFINPEADIFNQVLILSLGCLLVATLIGLIYAIFAAHIGQLLQGARSHRVINTLSGLIFIGFGIGIVFS
jgi:homoserine/homoserine lactone efflux protein